MKGKYMNKYDNDSEKKREIPKIIIDQQFKELLPALDKQTYAMLEESLLENGCIHTLVLWNCILIDGHNRYEICKRHRIPFTTIEKDFKNRDEALIWIISTQVARRNLTPIQLSYYRGVHYNADKRLEGNPAWRTESEQMDQLRQSDAVGQNLSTARRLAEQYNVSSRTIDRDAQVARAIDAIGKNSPEAKKSILSGAADVSRKYLRELGTEAEDMIRETAESIAGGTFERQKTTVEAYLSAFDILEALNMAVSKITYEFENTIQRLKDEIGENNLKIIMRGHIEILEYLYKLI
jgi:hypothetical protein